MSSTAAEFAVDAAVGESAEAVAVLLERVSKRFGEVPALSDVSLPIRRGELMTLLGPSGCGKTTLLNLVAGFFAPDTGRISIDGRLVNHVPTYKREIGMMFQSYALFPHMTVAANIAYGLKARHLPKREIVRRVGDMLALVKLERLGDRKPRQLSGGQQQRVALARALVISPTVLLLDEPFSALDKNLRASMQLELRDIQRTLGVTTIFVTHDQSEALSISDRIAVMAEGRIRQVGTPEAVYGAPCERFVASFVGDVNVLRARLVRIDDMQAIIALGAVQMAVPSAPLRGIAAPAPVDLFVRPEHLQLADVSEPCASTGTIVAQVYQGAHVDVYIECVASSRGRLLIRLAGAQGVASRPIGARVGLLVCAGKGIAFAAA